MDSDARVCSSERDDYNSVFPTKFQTIEPNDKINGWSESGWVKISILHSTSNVVEYQVVLGDFPFSATFLGGSSPMAKHAQWRMAKDSSRISCKRPRPPIRAESGKYQLGVLTKTYPHCCEIGGTWGELSLGDIHLIQSKYYQNQESWYIGRSLRYDRPRMCKVKQKLKIYFFNAKEVSYHHISESKGRERKLSYNICTKAMKTSICDRWCW